MISKEKLKELLKELSRPKKYEVGFADARRIVSDGLAIIGLDASDILGFAKEANKTKTRRTKGAQAWFKRMYEDGWRFPGQFDYEGILYAGFVIMERELPNKKLEELIETITDETVVRTGSAMELDRGPELPRIYGPGQFDYGRNKPKENVGEGVGIKDVKIIPKPVKEMEETKAYIIPEAVKEPKEGFDTEIAKLVEHFQNAGPTDEEQFFKDTGKNAVWRGKETKAFIKWKEPRD